MIDLTLDSMLVPALEGYKPVVGKKIEYTALNKGGLNTQQVVENIAMPFVKQRSVIIDKSETSSVIEYDASIMINGVNVTFTLDRGVSPGIEIQVMCLQSASIRYVGIYQNTVTDHLNAFTIAKYIWTGSAWFCSSAPGIGSVKEQFPGTPEPFCVYGGQWEELSLAGMSLRAAGGDARPFTHPMMVTISGTSVIVNTSDDSSNYALQTLSIGDLLVGGGEYRTVTAKSGNTITIDRVFSSPGITAVYIGQSAGVPNITGEFDPWAYSPLSHTTQAFSKIANNAYSFNSTSAINGSRFKFDASKGEIKINGTLKNDVFGKSNRVQVDNITILYWKRIS